MRLNTIVTLCRFEGEYEDLLDYMVNPLGGLEMYLNAIFPIAKGWNILGWEVNWMPQGRK